MSTKTLLQFIDYDIHSGTYPKQDRILFVMDEDDEYEFEAGEDDNGEMAYFMEPAWRVIDVEKRKCWVNKETANVGFSMEIELEDDNNLFRRY